MKSRHIVLVVLILAVMGVYYFKDRRQTVDPSEADSGEETQVATPPRFSPAPSQPANVSADATAAIETPQDTQNQPTSEAVQKRFAGHMANLEKCLHLSSASAVLPVLQPTPDQLMAQLRGSLGEPVVQLEDWTQFDVIDKAGVKKRVRVDYDYPDGATPNRRLSSYTLNSYGSYEIDNLTNDQSDNPNEAYIESLKEGQRLTQEEKSSRIYFSQGEELLVGMKNGRLTSMSVTRGEYAYNCNNLSEETSTCTCP